MERKPQERQARVEITPEMIEAGVDVLLEFDHDWSNNEEYAEKIYRIMESCTPRYGKSVPGLSH